MTLQPGMFRGAAPGRQNRTSVDYRMARRAVIRNFHNGRLSRLDVCDAHPELIRAAQNVGDPTSEVCPICEETTVVLVSYAFGSGLAPGGHCVTDKGDLRRLKQRTPELTCYVVEVCPECRWNHLARSFQIAGKARRSTG